MGILRCLKAVAFIVALVLAGKGFALQPETMDLRVEPSGAVIGVVYGGVEVRVSCEVKPGTQTAMLITGPRSDLHLRMKQRVWGLFWAPAEDVTFEDMPSLYLLCTAAELMELAPEPVLKELDLGYDALGPRDPAEGGDLFQELIRLKESEAMFSASTDGIFVDKDFLDGRRRVTAVFHLPANAPPTTYSVRVFAFRDRELVARGEGVFELRLKTLTAFLTSLAREHALLYGILAVVIALAAGLAVGFLYGSTGKH